MRLRKILLGLYVFTTSFCLASATCYASNNDAITETIEHYNLYTDDEIIIDNHALSQTEEYTATSEPLPNNDELAQYKRDEQLAIIIAKLGGLFLFFLVAGPRIDEWRKKKNK